MSYDVIVVGGGHAGLEAAFACAKMGGKTLLISLNFKMIGHMPCNPSIGGSAKGIVVREIDALGGMMPKAADYQYLQMKMLNTAKGQGVQCLRSQNDRLIYQTYMQKQVLNTKNLSFLEGMVIDLLHDHKKVFGVVLDDGRRIEAKAVILTTGTYLDSCILRGHDKHLGGPDGEKPAIGLSNKLKEMGIEIVRFKTGTPPRIRSSSIDYSKAQIQLGTKGDLAFSYLTDTYIPFEKQLPCYLIYTTPETHKIVLDNLDKTAMYSGLIEGIGPRYCPSIESKITTFKDKERHQLFIEPESSERDLIYLQGFSTSMCKEIQEKMVHSLPGMENAEIIKYAYAIEYDCVNPLELTNTLMFKKYNGLYGAGQIDGTSGYEEAAGLGIYAGINAMLTIKNEPPFLLRRDEAYIGVMVDDLITKGTNEPYRLLSSRAEYRLLLRHDNADQRLYKYGHKYGLISEEIYNKYLLKEKHLLDAYNILSHNHIGQNDKLNIYLKSIGYSPLKGGLSGRELLSRPLVSFEKIKEFFPLLDKIPLTPIAILQLETDIKYKGYILKQQKAAENLKKLEEYKIPDNISYLDMDGLALEARQKLDRIRPTTIGQASRISGVNPSDISILILQLKLRKNIHEQ